MNIPIWKIKVGRGKFCSHSCNASYNHKGLNKPMTEKHKENLSKALKGRTVWNKMPLIDITCVQCGKIFQVNNPRKSIAKCCSIECSNLYKKTINGTKHKLFKRVLKTCEWCGKEVYVKRAKLHEFRFCSRQCLGSWIARHIHRPTTPEIIVSKSLKELGLQFETEYKIGKYSCDFALLISKVVIEVDGTYWHSTTKRKRLDKAKDEFLSNLGWVVLRFKEKDIYQNLTKCLTRLNKHIRLIQD
jgi:very-short-patch-repair endonuclease